MNTASLDKCKELYELSGWDDTYHVQELTNFKAKGESGDGGIDWVPAYDSGYLLRKLPRHLRHKSKGIYHLIVQNGNESDDTWIADYYQKYGRDAEYYAVDILKLEAKLTESDTPENALCQLAIELFKQGLLKRD